MCVFYSIQYTMKNSIYFFLLVLLACEANNNTNTSSETGTGGSLARFAIVGDHLYTVDNQSLRWFDVSEPANPIAKNDTYIGWNIETIYPSNQKLFIGSQGGMYVYEIKKNGFPEYLSEVQHFYSCDPVVANSTHAFVTLSTGSACRRSAVNEMLVVQLNDLKNMEIVATYPMLNPKGLGLMGNKLIVCDKGLRLYDITNPLAIRELEHYDVAATDVIPVGDLLLVIGDEGLIQYYLSDNRLELLSRLSL